jgi:hypothetical protein
MELVTSWQQCYMCKCQNFVFSTSECVSVARVTLVNIVDFIKPNVLPRLLAYITIVVYRTWVPPCSGMADSGRCAPSTENERAGRLL